MPMLWFIAGYVLLGAGVAKVLSQYDSEPLGAYASLLLFALFSAITTAAAMSVTQAALHKRVGKFPGLALGAVCSITSSLSAGATYLGLNFWVSLALVFSAPALLAATAVFLIPKPFVAQGNFSSQGE